MNKTRSPTMFLLWIRDHFKQDCKIINKIQTETDKNETHQDQQVGNKLRKGNSSRNTQHQEEKYGTVMQFVITQDYNQTQIREIVACQWSETAVDVATFSHWKNIHGSNAFGPHGKKISYQAILTELYKMCLCSIDFCEQNACEIKRVRLGGEIKVVYLCSPLERITIYIIDLFLITTSRYISYGILKCPEVVSIPNQEHLSTFILTKWLKDTIEQ